MKYTEEQLNTYDKMRESVLMFIEIVWGLVPQPIHPDYEARWKLGLLLTGEAWKNFCKQVRPEWFLTFEQGRHLTWQQSLVLYGVDKIRIGAAPARISIVSGHGTGKSTTASWIIIWFLYVHINCQVACTSPGSAQLYDVLWKELKKWIDMMPPGMRQSYVWESTHIRINTNPNVWFARAKTASKENTEALAGVHADHVLLIGDEASGIEEPIYETMEGALTSGNTIVFLVSNGTRNMGYFYDTHHKDSARWQNYQFSSLDSPKVDQKYVDNIVAKYGADSAQYAIRVEGKFPDEGVMDDKGYVQLFNEKDLHFIQSDPNWVPVGKAISALDASGEGQDISAWAVRDRQRAMIVAEEEISTPASMGNKSVTICDKFKIDPIDFVIDSFGKGSDVSMEIALITSNAKNPWRTFPVNVGEQCEDEYDKLLYVNKRAEMYYKFMKWCQMGGELMESRRLKDELLSVRFKRTVSGRIQIMDKVTMKKMGFPSPNKADAIALTFLRPDGIRNISASGSFGERSFNPFTTCD